MQRSSTRSNRGVSLKEKRNHRLKQNDMILKKNSFSDMVRTINRLLVERFDEKIERKKYKILFDRVKNLVNEFDFIIPGIATNQLVEMIVDSITGYGILHPYIANQKITDIQIESPNDVFIMENLRWKRVPVNFGSEKQLEDYIHQLFNRLGGRFSRDNPLAKVEDTEWNLRIRGSGYDLRPDSPTLSIRKLRKEVLTEKEIRYAMSSEVESFLKFCMKAGFTTSIVGPFGSGKTTVMGTMLSWIPTGKHVSLIQSADEIQKVHPLMRRGITREQVGEMGKEINEIDLLEFAKQESYQVIALGEFLNEAALTMLHILQLGIQSCFTFHANDPDGAIQSFIFMMKQAATDYDTLYLIQELAKHMDILIIMDRLRVREIVQFTGEVDQQTFTPKYETLWKFDISEEHRYELRGNWKRNVDVRLTERLTRKAKMNGIKIPEHLGLI